MTSSAPLTLFSPAKINLFLHITGKRDDGYHNLQTVFRLLNWGDSLQFQRSQYFFDPVQCVQSSHSATDSLLPISLQSNVTVTDNLADNLITKAAITLLKAVSQQAGDTQIYKEHNRRTANQINLPSKLAKIDITLNKILPTGAGLGGGSSNAATTLIALNQLWGFNLTPQALLNIAQQIGADVPIFIFAKDAIGEGIGEKLTPITLPPQHFLVLNPSAHASTQALFKHPNLRRNISSLSSEEIKQQAENYLTTLDAPYHNVFQKLVCDLVPEVAAALSYLQQLQSITNSTARMTGTGSGVFLPIPDTSLEAIKYHIEHVSLPPCDAVLTQSL